MEIKYQKLEEVKPDTKLICSASFKPTLAPIIICVAGIGLLFINNLWTRLLGVFFIAMPLLVIFLVKDKKTMDVYENGCLIFNPSNSELAYFINFDDIEEWDVLHESGHDTVEFVFPDKNRAVVDTFQTNKIYNALDKVCRQKNHVQVQERKNKELNLNPIDAFRNIVNRKKK